MSDYISRRVVWPVLVLAGCLAGCKEKPANVPAQFHSSPAPAAAVWFEEISKNSGLDFQHVSGHQKRFLIPEMETGGVGLLDFDNDGWLDIYCVQGGSLYPNATHRPGNKLYRNLGQWRFVDVTGTAGVGDNGYGMGCVCADFDNDGDIDLYVTNVGPNVLYRNNGDGTFRDWTQASGTGHTGWGTSGAFFDYDLDGNLDLVIANYLNWSIDREVECFSHGGQPDYCSPMNYRAPAMDTLYHNEGNGTFRDVTIEAGLDKAYGNGLGVVCADFDRDGRADIFVANDAMPNQLWMNRGDGKFVDEALLRGCAVNRMGITEAGMGVAAVDLFQRGWLDIFVTHLVGEGNRLWVNTNGFFNDWVTPKGPGAPSLLYTGFGVIFEDFDNDGELDMYAANGRVKLGPRSHDPADPYAEPNNLLRGLGQGDFAEVLPHGGTQPPLIATSRAVAAGDLDNDGAVDLVVINRDGPAHLLRNVAARQKSWLGLRVLNRKGHDAIGAMVRLEAGGRIQWRQVNPHQSYCASNDPRIHFGLGDAPQVDRLRVEWPGGETESFGPFHARQYVVVRQGAGKSEARWVK
ncbi:MAG: CRTAC1 family protein [Verrucomicrobiota bacterium]